VSRRPCTSAFPIPGWLQEVSATVSKSLTDDVLTARVLCKTFVEIVDYGVEVSLAMDLQVGEVGQVPAQQRVAVLVEPSDSGAGPAAA
jgi:hypothetical protein